METVAAVLRPAVDAYVGSAEATGLAARQLVDAHPTVFSPLVLALAAACLVAFMVRFRALRGSHRRPLPWLVDKACRLFVLLALAAPLIYAAPSAGLALTAAYSIRYLDGAEKDGRRTSDWVRGWALWRAFGRYFSLRLINTTGVPLDPRRQYVIGVHPHGILPVCTMVMLQTKVCNADGPWFLNGIQLRGLVASFAFCIPGLREIFLGGGMTDASRYVAHRHLNAGHSVVLVPGGAHEALYAGTHRLVLRRRKGFIQLALEHGASLVPMYCFGESEIFTQSRNVPLFLRRIQFATQKFFGIPVPPLLRGAGPIGLWPRRVPVTGVVGAPIAVPRVPHPTQHQIDALADRYEAALRALHGAHREAHMHPKQDLVIT